MTGLEYLATIVEGLAVLLVCGFGLYHLGALLRKAWLERRPLHEIHNVRNGKAGI
jgi:hypothetical protein